MFGIYKNMSIEDYHNDPAISRSGLVQFKRSPWHYWNAYLNPNRPAKKETDALILGNAFHTYVLEPSSFDERYIIMPEKVTLKDNGREKYDAYKAQIEEIENNLGNKQVLTKTQFDTLEGMYTSLKNNHEAYELILDGLYEHSVFWQDPHTGIKCKTRPDIWHENIVVDLKSIDSADERSFQRSMIDYGYHLQAAMNREGILRVNDKDIKSHVFVCVEKKFPFAVAVYILDLTVIEYAHIELKNLLTSFAGCKQKNNWEGYQTKTIFLPNWMT